MARAALAAGDGAGVVTARHLPGARVVRAFNTVAAHTLESQAHRAGDRVGIPLASDDATGMDEVARLVSEAGFDPVQVGPLTSAARFDPGTAVFNTGFSGREVRLRLGLA
jgi:predicted dinucleotide-binding enzyme